MASEGDVRRFEPNTSKMYAVGHWRVALEGDVCKFEPNASRMFAAEHLWVASDAVVRKFQPISVKCTLRKIGGWNMMVMVLNLS